MRSGAPSTTDTGPRSTSSMRADAFAEHHFGEGEYERSETGHPQLLAETGVTGDDQGVVSVTANGFELPADWRNLKSPEIYLGFDRTENFSSPGGAALARRRDYAAPDAAGAQSMGPCR